MNIHIISRGPWRPVPRRVLQVPGMVTIEAAIDWLRERGCGPEIYLKRGPDNLIRGFGVAK